MPALAPTSRLIEVLTDLYDTTSCCPDLEARAAANDVDPKERKLFEALAKARHDNPGQPRADALKSKEWQELYKYVSGRLVGGVEKGYGKTLVKTDFGAPDYGMLSKLSENVHWFSANKNWQLLVDLNAQLKAPDGKLREWADFKKEALKLDKQYNTVWLRTEYNAAVASSQMAAKWVEFEANADDTYLRFDTAGDRRVRPAHALLDGITLPATDPFWNTYWPPLDFGCRCDATEILRSKTKPTDLQKKGPLPQIAQGFKSNVGKSGQVFDESHPYFGGVPKAEQQQLREMTQQELLPPGYTQVYQGKAGGYVQLHETHGKHEKADNLRIGKHLANQGERVRLLPVDETPGHANPDATRNGTIWEFKTPESKSGKNGTQNAIKQASAQNRENLLVELNPAYKVSDIIDGLKAAFQPGRAKSLKQLDLMLPDGQTVNFTAEQLLDRSFINRLKKRAGSQLES